MSAERAGTDGPGPLSLAVGYATAGRDALARHEESEAILAYERALPLAQAAVATGDGPHEDLVRFLVYVHDVLGGLMVGRSDLDQAEQHYTAALELAVEREADSADVVKFTNNLGAVARQRGDLSAALTLYRAATELAERMDPVPDAVATCWSNTGTILLAMGDLGGAAATKARIFQEVPGYRVVHFATHGVIDDRDPLYSGLQVAPAGSLQPGDSRGSEVARHDPGGRRTGRDEPGALLRWRHLAGDQPLARSGLPDPSADAGLSPAFA
jgi:tetratricopeptide (TPR) repeat protein